MNKSDKRRNKKFANQGVKKTKPIQVSSPMSDEQEQKLTIQQPIDLAIQHHQTGDLAKAEGIYQQILRADPNQPIALHFLGLIAHQGGENDRAVKLISDALKIKPNYAEAHCNLGLTLKDLGKLDEAVTSYKYALAIKPNFALVYSNMGIALKALGRLDEAVESYSKALNIKPDYAEAHSNLGNALRDLGLLDEAVASCHKAIAIKPDYAEAYSNLGNALQDLGQLGEAVTSYNKALAHKPDYAEAHANLGAALLDLGKLDEAVESYISAIALKPDYSEFHNKLGWVFLSFGKLDEATTSFNKAIDIRPDYPEALNNLGSALQASGKLEEAIVFYRLAGLDSSKHKLLECLYQLQKIKAFNSQLKSMVAKDGINIGVAAISAFAAHQLGQDNPYPFCKNPLALISIGQVADHTNNPNDFLIALNNELRDRNTLWNPQGQSIKSGFQTLGNLFTNPSSLLTKLEQIINDELLAYYNHFRSIPCLYMDMWPEVFTLNGWFVRLVQHGHHKFHIHPTGWLSGVIYLNLPRPLEAEEGAIEFGLNGYDLPMLKASCPKHLHQPQRGDIVLFPSSLFHRTLPFTASGERVVVAFDLYPQEMQTIID
jgi:tetratricopeptide (TPR) repeat protein